MIFANKITPTNNDADPLVELHIGLSDANSPDTGSPTSVDMDALRALSARYSVEATDTDPDASLFPFDVPPASTAGDDCGGGFRETSKPIGDLGRAKPIVHIQRSEGGTDEPLPLFTPLGESTPYPLNALGCLQAAAEAIARKVQVPASTAAQSVLAVAALAAQAHADVGLPYGQKRPLSLFMVTVAASGDRKSSADNEASRPVAEREKILRDLHAADASAFKIAHAAWQSQKRKIEADKKLGMKGKADALATIGPEPLPPLVPILSMSDLTLDGITKNLANAHPSLAIFTAEGGTFTGGHSMSEENRLRTAASLSEFWDGKLIKRVRAADGVTILPGRRLSVHLMIQPNASHSFIANPVLRDQGLLSRVLVASPESLAGGRLYRDPEPADEAAIQAFEERILSILEAPQPLVDGRNELEPRVLRMTDDATALWVDFFNDVESQSGAKGKLAGVYEFAAKSAEHVARIAGVLTIARDLEAEAIDRFEMECAIELMSWYLREADRLQSASRLDPRLLRAAELLKWMQSHGGEIQFRDIIKNMEIRRVMQNSLTCFIGTF
jgi:hypothetical protein